MVTERSLAVATHGRYLVDAPAAQPAPWPMLVGFHGYAESADTELDRLRSIPGADRWLLVSIQGLHRFYRGRNEDVVAGWMTRQDRTLAIADNVAYASAVLHDVAREWETDGRVVLTGFSQGVSMAFRAAAAGAGNAGSVAAVIAVIALGGDVPPELDAAALAGIPAVLIGRGSNDALYDTEAFDSDVHRLGASGVHVDALALDAGHEWTEAFSRCGRFVPAPALTAAIHVAIVRWTLVVDRRLALVRAASRSLERMIAPLDDVDRRVRRKTGEDRLELGRRAERIAAPLHEQHRPRHRRQMLVAALRRLSRRVQRISEQHQAGDRRLGIRGGHLRGDSSAHRLPTDEQRAPRRRNRFEPTAVITAR